MLNVNMVVVDCLELVLFILKDKNGHEFKQCQEFGPKARNKVSLYKILSVSVYRIKCEAEKV